MDWAILWWILAGVLVIAGLVGTIVPALPGIPLMNDYSLKRLTYENSC